MTPLYPTLDASSTFATLGTWSSPLFTSMLPMVLLVSGITVGALIVVFMSEGLVGAFTGMFHKKDKY